MSHRFERLGGFVAAQSCRHAPEPLRSLDTQPGTRHVEPLKDG
jgi:hypothetical protein